MVTVLVVDDSKFMAKAIGRLLQAQSFDVVAVAHDGIEGLSAFREHQPNVTLLDITMPNMDGLECLTHIRKEQPDAIVVMLSAIQDEEIIARCTEAGAAAYLQKPIRGNDPTDVARLTDTINAAIGVTV